MSARPCTKCGKVVIFAKDRQTDKWVILTNQATIWRKVATKNGVPYVVKESGIFSAHYCTQPDQPAATMPEPDVNYQEPKEIA